jgi:hypothetical protein
VSQVTGQHDTAELLLGVDRLTGVAERLITRAMLPDGRFEAHEFGRDQHSSASAGGLLIGLAGAPVDDGLIEPVAHAVLDLIAPDGSIRGHDADEDAGNNTWAESQILLGLLMRPWLARPGMDKVMALVHRLLATQHSGGGWSLRTAEHPAPIFAFYAALALLRVLRAERAPAVRHALLRTGHYLGEQLSSRTLGLEERVLALFLHEHIRSALPGAGLPDLTDARRTTIDQCWSAEDGLLLRDHTTVISTQPVWHSITWRPLLYLCVRKWLPPLHCVAATLGAELVSTFHRSSGTWPGPVGAVSRETGSSWASGLALRGVATLAADLDRAGTSAAEFADRAAELRTSGFVYDVAISFAGADRAIAETIARHVQASGLRVFYDRDHQHSLLGEDLAALLQNTYFRDSRYAIVLVSRAFLASKWAGNWEWRAVLARMQSQHTGYVLPYIVEDITVPGLNPTYGHVSAADFSPSEFAALVVRKLRGRNP